MTHKILNLRVFEDEQGKMNRSIQDIGGEILSISQFTLFADVRKGNRPSFIKAGKPEHADITWIKFNEALRSGGVPVKEGRFGAHMRVGLVNDGPVTIIIDTEIDMPGGVHCAKCQVRMQKPCTNHERDSYRACRLSAEANPANAGQIIRPRPERPSCLR